LRPILRGHFVGDIIAAADMKVMFTALMAIVVACSSTASPASNPEALAHGASVKKLDAGRVESLPTGAVYIRFVRFAQPPGYVINSKQHVPSAVYVETGIARLILAGQAPIDLVAGQAAFHQSVTHMHLNPGPDPSVWYSIAVWPGSARGQPLVDPIARAAFESVDVERAALPQVAYSQVLREVTLAKLGTTGAHRFGGLSAFYVLSGSVTIRSAHRSPVTLGVDQGGAFLPDVDLQESNAGTDQAVFLEFLNTPVGKDFEVPLKQLPAA
jgi:quercetin dioxygenase-like cupin family protein